MPNPHRKGCGGQFSKRMFLLRIEQNIPNYTERSFLWVEEPIYKNQGFLLRIA